MLLKCQAKLEFGVFRTEFQLEIALARCRPRRNSELLLCEG